MINNRLRNSPTGFVIMGEDYNHPSQQTQRFLIRNNLFEQIARMGFYITQFSDDIEIDHNTFVPTSYLPFIMTGLKGRDASGNVIGKPCRRFKLSNNIFGFGDFGPGVDGGKNTFAEAFPDATWGKNLLVGWGEGRAESVMKKKDFPPGFLFETKKIGDGKGKNADWAAVGFVDFSGGNFRLSDTSRYKAAGSDGAPLGANVDVIETAVKKAK